MSRLPHNLKGLFPEGGKTFPDKKRFRATGEYRVPQKGEYYLSGAIIEAYQAPFDLEFKQWIGEMVELVECPHCGGYGKVAKS